MSNSNESYIREHKLKQLMEFLMEQLLNKKPSNPEKYLIKILERRQSLLAEKPKTVSFKSFCKLKTALLSFSILDQSSTDQNRDKNQTDFQ